MSASNKVKAKIENGMLILALPLTIGLPKSKAGKSRIVAQTMGFQETTAMCEGFPVKISGISAIIPLGEDAK